MQIRSSGRALTGAIFLLTVTQLVLGTFVSSLHQFDGKGFGYRLAVYPVLMLVAPAWWRVRSGRRTAPRTCRGRRSR